MPKVAERVLMYWPPDWGEATKFQRFYAETHSLDPRQNRELNGVTSHFMKARRLRALVEALKPGLELDEAELEANGYTSRTNATQLATVLEAVILELYSTLDCTVKVLRAIYGQKVGGKKGSTRTFFQELQKPDSDLEKAPVPPMTAAAAARATWYKRLLHLRDELTHSDAGGVRLDPESGIVGYEHDGIREGGAPLHIPDVLAWLDETFQNVNGFVGAAFRELNLGLLDKPVWMLCGMVQGRALFRWVSPVGETTFDSGHCGAYVWFEADDAPDCPFREGCGAYARKAPRELFGTGGGPALD